MNLQELMERTRRQSGLRLPALLSDADLAAALNEAYRDLVVLKPWPQFRFETSVAVEAGQSDVELPVAVYELTAVQEGDLRLQQTTTDELDRLEPDRAGPPALYAALTERKLRLYPTPDEPTSLQVRGFRRPPALVAPTDTPEFDQEYHPVLSYATAARLLAEEGDSGPRRDAYVAEAADLVARAERRYLRTHDRPIIQWGGRGGHRRRLPYWGR